MSDKLYDKIVAQKGSFERLVAKIPGFKGYHEKEARREADRLLRLYIAQQMQDRVTAFTRLEKKVLDKTGLRYMSRTRDIKSVLQTYQDRIETAAPKYDGMWAQMKIGTEELERIYAFDEAQMRYVESFDVLFTALEESIGGEEFETNLDKVYELAVEANDAFKLRDDVIIRLDGTI